MATELRFTSIDTKATTLNPGTARILEVGTARFDGPRIRLFSRRVCPGVPIPQAASRLHGLTESDVATAPPFGRIAPRLLAYLTETQLVGYNALGFDVPTINAELHCCNLAQIDPAQVLDVLVFVNWHFREWPSRKLPDLCGWFEVPLEQAHQAVCAAQATGLLLRRLVTEGFVPADPPAALAQQAEYQGRLAQEQAAWGSWLYESRSAAQRRLVIGCGKYQGVPLSKVDRRHLRRLLERHLDPHDALRLPKAVVGIFAQCIPTTLCPLVVSP